MTARPTDLPVHSCSVEITNRRGLHARAAAKVVKMVSNFSADVRIRHEDKEVLATSIMGLMFLGATQGTTVEITAKGIDATPVLEAIKLLIQQKFSEE